MKCDHCGQPGISLTGESNEIITCIDHARAYDRLHGLDGHIQSVTPGRIPPAHHEHDASGCLECGCSAAPWSSARHTAPCTCGQDMTDPKPGSLEYAQMVADRYGDIEDAAIEDGMDPAPNDDEPCLCGTGFTCLARQHDLRTRRERLALVAARDLGDDDEAPAALKARIDEAEFHIQQVTEAREWAERQAESAEAELARLKSAASHVGHQAACQVDPCDCWMQELTPLLGED